MATMQPTLEAEIAEVESKLSAMDVMDEATEAEFGRLHVQLESLKARRSTRRVPPAQPGNPSYSRRGDSMTAASTATHRSTT